MGGFGKSALALTSTFAIESHETSNIAVVLLASIELEYKTAMEERMGLPVK